MPAPREAGLLEKLEFVGIQFALAAYANAFL
jgi:hypothetical protein